MAEEKYGQKNKIHPTGALVYGWDGSNAYPLKIASSAGELSLILLAGSADIGKVGHDVTGIGHGVAVCASAGTDVVIAASSTPAKYIQIQAQTDNTSGVAVGGSGVDATVANGSGVLLYAGDSLSMPIDNLTDVYIDALVNGEGVRYTYET